MLAKRIPKQNPDYRNDYKMIFRPLERLMYSTNHNHYKINNKSVASPKTALQGDLKGHSQKIFLSLVPRMATALLQKFPSTPTKRTRALTPNT